HFTSSPTPLISTKAPNFTLLTHGSFPRNSASQNIQKLSKILMLLLPSDPTTQTPTSNVPPFISSISQPIKLTINTSLKTSKKSPRSTPIVRNFTLFKPWCSLSSKDEIKQQSPPFPKPS